jgi:hypothetical protein
MIVQDLEKELLKLAQNARDLGYKVTTPTLFADSIYGSKLAYYQHGANKIVLHEDYMTNGSEAEVENTLVHELAHAIAEQNNETKKPIWHGDAWKAINTKLGGNAERYHQGGYTKPAPVKKTMAELFAIQPTKPADTWDRGTFKQWLSRGYHVIKGQKGELSVWTFSADEYETATDDKTSTFGRVSAVYFTPDQVEANKPAKVTA